MNNIELFYFLGKCLSLGDNEKKDQELMQTIRQEKVDWERFVVVASNHLVLPSVYLRFKQKGIIQDLPTGLGEHLKMVYELNYQRNTTILSQINRINQLLAKAGIIAVYLKGSGNLLDNLYEDVGERMCGDIDLMVSDTEFIQSVNLMKAEGYEHYHPFFNDEQPVTKHFPRLSHSSELADVEVHRVPVDVRLSTHFNYTIIRPEVKLVDTVPPCYVLSDQHKVILNFMHGFMDKNIRVMHMVSFRNMVDLFFLSRRVDVYKVFSEQTQYASKALVYADFVNHVMGIANSSIPGKKSKRFIRQHDLLLKSKFWFRFRWLTSYLVLRVWSGYVCNAAGVFFSKRIRRTVFLCLSNPSWYKRHLKSYTDSIKHIYTK